jgi:hypothetical protein
MSEVYERLASAEAEYSAAVQRQNQLGAELNATRAAVRAAGEPANLLLAAAAEGNEVTHQQILDARSETQRISTTEEIAEAKYQHAAGLTRKAHADLLSAQAGAIQHETNVADQALVDAAAKVDAVIADAHRALAEFRAQGKATDAAHARAASFTAEVRAATEGNEVLQKQRQLGTIPHVVYSPHSGVVDPQVELFLDLNRGRIDAHRQVVPSLAVLVKAR